VFRIAAIVFLLLWVLGLVTGHTMGGFVHALLVLALVLGLIGLVRGNNGWCRQCCPELVTSSSPTLPLPFQSRCSRNCRYVRYTSVTPRRSHCPAVSFISN
jgi:hypothetical protein